MTIFIGALLGSDNSGCFERSASGSSIRSSCGSAKDRHASQGDRGGWADDITVTLDRSVALVLFEFLSRTTDEEDGEPLADALQFKAELPALWATLAALEERSDRAVRSGLQRTSEGRADGGRQEVRRPPQRNSSRSASMRRRWAAASSTPPPRIKYNRAHRDAGPADFGKPHEHGSRNADPVRIPVCGRCRS